MIFLQASTDIFFDSVWFKGARAVIEILYLISAPLVAYLAFRGLEQIKIAKKESILNSRREALKITAERCDDYCNRIIPLINALSDAEKAKGVTFFEDSTVNIEDGKVFFKVGENVDFEKVSAELLSTLNALESFSIFFVKRLGDENVAYEAIGQTFISTVKRYSPLSMLYENGKRSKNTITLFKLWYERNEKEKLEIQKMKIESKLKKTKSVALKHLGEE